jgi:ubiquinone/menaquinone biosynthesis C-methylase UbiE
MKTRSFSNESKKEIMTDVTENAAKNTHNVVEKLLLDGKTKHQIELMKVLDLPCGEGAFTKRLLQKNIEVIPSDIVNILNINDGTDNFESSDMDRPLPFDNKLFTEIVCIDGIEHIERPFDFIRECNRVIVSSGRIIIATPNISAIRSRWRYFLTGHHNKCKSPLNEENITPLHHKSMMSFPEMRYILHTTGFEIEKVRTNRIKAISYLYGIFYPLLYLTTSMVYSKEEKDFEQRKRNAAIRRAMFSNFVYYGETIIICARKK